MSADYKPHPFRKYQSGVGEQSTELWWKLIAKNERKRGNPAFEGWSPADVNGWTDAQRYFLSDYFDKLREMSRSAYKARGVAKKRGAAAEQIASIEKGIFIICDSWYKDADSGIYRSWHARPKGVRAGAEPEVSGGKSFEKTIWGQLAPIYVCPRRDLIANIVRQGITVRGETGSYALDGSNVEAWFDKNRQKSRGLFKFHGEGCWSTTHKECVSPSTATRELAFSKAKSYSDADKIAGGQTECQELHHALFYQHPNVWVKYDSDDCPLWQWVQEDGSRLDILTQIQARSKSKRTTEMQPREFLHYIFRHRKDMTRSEVMRPSFDLENGSRQGKGRYPAEVFRAFKGGSKEEFRAYCEEHGFAMEHWSEACRNAVRKGDLIPGEDGKRATGADVFENEKKAKEESERKFRVSQAKPKLIGRLRSELADSWVLRGCAIIEAIDKFAQDSEGQFNLDNMNEVLELYPENHITQADAQTIWEAANELELVAA